MVWYCHMIVNVKIVIRPTIILVGRAPHGVCDGVWVWAFLPCEEGDWEFNRSLMRSDRRSPNSCKLIRGGSLNSSTAESWSGSEMSCASDCVGTLSVSFPRMIWLKLGAHSRAALAFGSCHLIWQLWCLQLLLGVGRLIASGGALLLDASNYGMRI